MKLKINTIMFDFDGVIVDSGADIVHAVQYAQNYFGKPVLSAKEITGYIGKGVEYLLKMSFKEYSEDFLKDVKPVYMKYYMDNAVVNTSLYSNVKETLEALAGKNLAVITNKPENLTLKILKELGIRDYFTMVIGPESVSKLKPDPEGLKKFLDAVGCEPAKAIMIGDSYTDIEAGRSAGTYTCGVTYGIGSLSDLKNSKPDFLIDNMIQLLDIVEG